MHSNPRRRGGMGRWLATGAAVLAVALPVAAATASASVPPSEPTDTAAGDTMAGDTTTGDSAAGGSTCADVFVGAATGSEAPAGDTTAAGSDMATADTSMAAGDTAMADDAAAAPDTAAMDDTSMAAVDTAMADDAAAPDTGAAGTETAGSGPESATVTLIQTAETSLGTILVDGECRALYVFTQDEGGESTCFEGCATAWPPALVEGGALPELGPDLDPSLFTVVDHPLGPMVSVGGWPLYYFASDVAPGDLLGHGVNEVWFVVSPDGTLIEAPGAGGGDSAPAGSAAPTDSAAAGSDAMATTDTEAKATDGA